MKTITLILIISSAAPVLHCSSSSTELTRIAPRQSQSPYATLQNPDNPSCCTSIGIQQCLYKNKCKCEHPCVFIAATGCAGDAGTIAVISAALCGAVSIKAALPTALCLGVPSLLLTGCAACETYKRCKSNNTNQLDYITDRKNWPKQISSDHSGPDLGYDSGYESLPD